MSIAPQHFFSLFISRKTTLVNRVSICKSLNKLYTQNSIQYQYGITNYSLRLDKNFFIFNKCTIFYI